MRKLLTAFLVVPLLCAMTQAQPKLRGDKVYKPHQKIVIAAEEVTSKSAQFLWDVDGTGEVEYEEVGSKLYVWAPPGKYKVTLTAVDFETKKIERARASFTVDGKPSPGPGPDPGPDPTPPGPGPVAKSVRVLVTYVPNGKRTAEQQSIIQGQAFRDFTKSLGSDPNSTIGPARIWTTDQATERMPPEWKKLFDQKESGDGIVVEADGKVVHKGKLPANTKDVIDLVNKVAPRSRTSSKATILHYKNGGQSMFASLRKAG